jgi:hypothetical protein
MTADEVMHGIDAQLSHVWMVRTFLKHSEEAEEDDDLMDVVRDLYDYCLAVGPAWTAKDSAEYLKQARKKLGKLRAAVDRFAELQPQVSTHTNYQMAVTSLKTAVAAIGTLLDSVA